MYKTEKQGDEPCAETQKEKESNWENGSHSRSVTILFNMFGII